jgi:RNA polymerase sigma factor (sigma-70 family)
VEVDVSTDLTLVPPRPLVTSRTRRRAVEEDVAASLYREWAPAVLGYFRSQRATDPEDLLGEVFLHVARNVKSCRGDADARRRWVFTIAHHRLVDSWRRRAARPATTDQPPPEQIAVDGQPDTIDPELQAAIDTLTDEQRVVVLLRFIADLPLHDVARITRRPVGAVKALQHRGLAALERALTGELGGNRRDTWNESRPDGGLERIPPR